MNIGNLQIHGPAALAPMAGVADRAMRELCVEFGAAFVVGEMVSAKGLCMNDRKSAELLTLSQTERPAAVQLFGDDPEIMSKSIVKVLPFTPDAIDLNMGCPAPKIVNGGAGSALMKRPELAARIVAECVKQTTLPVTVKMRTGWDAQSINCRELAVLCERSGAAAVTVHGRFRQQMYAPPVDYDAIRQVKNAVGIPVIANGDVIDGKSAAAVYDKTRCDLVMVGRGALGRPWVFREINAYLKDGTILPEPTVTEKMAVMLRHIRLLCAYKGDYIGMLEARKHAAWYMKGLRGAGKYRRDIVTMTRLEQLEDIAERVVRDVGE